MSIIAVTLSFRVSIGGYVEYIPILMVHFALTQLIPFIDVTRGLDVILAKPPRENGVSDQMVTSRSPSLLPAMSEFLNSHVMEIHSGRLPYYIWCGCCG